MAATAVAQCLYFISSDEDAMEKVCSLGETVMTQVVQ